MTLLNLLDIDMVSDPSSGLVELLRNWRNLQVVNIRSKIQRIPTNGSNGASATKAINLFVKECPSDETDVAALEAGHASAIKLKNAKAAPHSVVASAREHEDDDDDDDADGDDADGSGAN
jgi:hypothetical protein